MDTLLALWRRSRPDMAPIEPNELLQLAAVSYSSLTQSRSAAGTPALTLPCCRSGSGSGSGSGSVASPGSGSGSGSGSALGSATPPTDQARTPCALCGLTEHRLPPDVAPCTPLEALQLMKQEGLITFSGRPGAWWALSVGAILYKRCVEPEDALAHRRPGCMQIMQSLHRIAEAVERMAKQQDAKDPNPTPNPNTEPDRPLYHGLTNPREQFEAYRPYDALAERRREVRQ